MKMANQCKLEANNANTTVGEINLISFALVLANIFGLTPRHEK
jgi:hypothetical protein